MSQPPPPYTEQPYPSASYHPQGHNPYPQQQYPNYPPPQQQYAPYPAGYHNPNQPQVVYVERQPQRGGNNDWWLTSLLALCCGCFLGEVCCDQPCLCCVFPCPRFRF